MTVYVDDFRVRHGRMCMCHMIADTLSELHAMADKIGLPREYFQPHPRHPHYDVCLTKRSYAVHAGAVEVSIREMAAILRKQEAAQ